MPKEGFLDRMEYSFSILKENKELIYISIAAYLFSYLLIRSIIFLIMKKMIFDHSFLFHPENLFSLALFLMLIFFLMFFFVFIKLGFIRHLALKQSGMNPVAKESMIYGARNIFKSFITYFHVFIYVYLIPCLLLIAGLLFLIEDIIRNKAAPFIGSDNLESKIGIGIVSLSIFIFIIFSFYRGTRSLFSIYAAVMDDSYTKDSFDESLRTTKGKCLRIFGNMLLLGIIIGLFSSLLGFFFSIGSSNVSKDMLTDLNLSQLKPFVSSIFGITIGGIISSIFNGLIMLFTVIFNFVFLLKLNFEAGIKMTTLKDKEIAQEL